MKALIKYGLCLSLGLAPTLAFSQELQWRPAGPVGLGRPVPLDGSGIPALRPIIRAQATEESKPLPPGPVGLGVKSSPITPAVTEQDAGKPAPKTGEFIAPPPQSTKSTTPVWSTADPCANPCSDACCGTGLFGCRSLLGHGTCADGLFGHSLLGPGVWGADPCNPCDPCARPRFWTYVDYLAWTPKNQSLPPLVTVSPAGTSFATTGVLGVNTTSVLFNGFDDPLRSGFRIGGGVWFHEGGVWGVDTNYWMLASSTNTFAAGGNGNPNISRPFFSVTEGRQRAEIVAFPFPPVGGVRGLGAANGTVSVREYQNIWGAEIDLRRKLWCGSNGWLDLQLGYRHFSLSEGLDITENIQPLGVNGASLGTNIVSDRFHTTNQFNGAQIGLAGQWRFLPRWTLNSNVRVAVGENHEVVDIQGNQIFNIPPIAPVTQPGGLLALGSNIGTRSADRFAVMPEVGLKLGYDLTPNLRLYVGYDFLYISSVVRPGDQIDLNVNRSQIPNLFGTQRLVGPAFPAPQFNTQSFWVQGLNVGMQYRY